LLRDACRLWHSDMAQLFGTADELFSATAYSCSLVKIHLPVYGSIGYFCHLRVDADVTIHTITPPLVYTSAPSTSRKKVWAGGERSTFLGYTISV
jgi:hypothetical protein